MLHIRPKECNYHDVTSRLLSGLHNSYLFYEETQPRALQLPFLGSMCQNLLRTGFSGSFHACTTLNRNNSWSGCLEIVCQTPAQSEVMLARANFLGADFKELFKITSVLVLWWWLQFKSLVNSASCKIEVTALSPYVSCLRVVGNVEQLEMIYIVSGLLPKTLIGNKQDLSACCLAAAADDETLLLKLW